MSIIRERLEKIHDRIARAARRVGRDPDGVRLVAVSKRVAPEIIHEAFLAGQILFGENYLQEATEKKKILDQGICWHGIGHLQSNKAAPAVATFDLIETVDRIKIARALQSKLTGQSRLLPVLIQVNIGKESQKSGVLPSVVDVLVEGAVSCENLQVMGLMVIPPYCDNPEEARPYFRATRELALRLGERGLLGQDGQIELSMGMSSDFEVAVEEGATLVRVGTALFGNRG
ncbi:MAG: YggS family pyridoxal phosphate-dependent enzyme [Proteobacteria bacterium]|nr:YggS family pyridoxal phosphate-dependent enzyme [Pseudomonadota bacterium]MBU1686645.1 YggS family pyridoxal phosphate-dependent enzyme [Pseudomonadota bacterium]